MKSKIKRIISYFVVSFLLVILASTIISKFILKTELIKVFDYAFLVVLTGSMEPYIHTGELIIIKEQSNYQIGDVITYKDKDNNFITHRIVYKVDDNYITKGDNNNISDDVILKNQIEGKVIFHSQKVGFFVLYLLKPLTIVYIVAILLYENYFNKSQKVILLGEPENSIPNKKVKKKTSKSKIEEKSKKKAEVRIKEPVKKKAKTKTKSKELANNKKVEAKSVKKAATKMVKKSGVKNENKK